MAKLLDRMHPTPVDPRDYLDQSEVWVGANGVIYQIDQLGEQHARNILGMIERASRGLLRETQDLYIWGPQPSGEMAQDLFQQELDWLLDAGPIEFIEELLVVRALRDRLAEIERFKKKTLC